ncbi:MAG TPA: hypothetical protein VFV66_24445 [Nonomuraea sp.]|nr:hypothetical protein [Nonomuraea sp.]
MNDRKGVSADATTQVRADAETARTTIETHRDVTYTVTLLDDGLVSYKPTEIPPTVEARAHDAGVAAVAEYKSRWVAEMKAHENDRQAHANGTAEPAAWLKDDPCDPWCVSDLDHDNSTDPDDRIHIGRSCTVELVTMPPVVVAYPERFAPPEIMFGLERKYREREPRIYLSDGGARASFLMTLTEAEAVATEMLTMVAEARGQASST